MAFIKFSHEYLLDSFTLIDNIFITEHLQYLPEDALRVYIGGLYFCSAGASNTLNDFASLLNMDTVQVKEAFKYLNEKGLVEVEDEPFNVKFLPLKRSVKAIRKFKKEKYTEFNRQLQDLFPDRMLTPNEYSEYYYFIESSKMAPEALLMIAKYCLDYKGMGVRYPYILTVASNWAKDGIVTVEGVESRLMELEAHSEDMQDLFRALGRKGAPTITDMQEYGKWTKSWGFSKESILFAAESLKGKGTISKLDRLLDDFFNMNIFDIKGMREYVKIKKELYDTAVAVNKALGLYYESLDNVINTYINPWSNKGYDKETLALIANYCFKVSIRKLEGMNDVINKFYKLGITTAEGINSYLNNLLINDDRISAILEHAGIRKNITNSDRNYYRIWSEEWGFSDEMISYAAELSSGRPRVFSYINKTLSDFKSKGIDTVVKAASYKPYNKENNKGYRERVYTKDQLNALFDDIEELED